MCALAGPPARAAAPVCAAPLLGRVGADLAADIGIPVEQRARWPAVVAGGEGRIRRISADAAAPSPSAQLQRGDGGDELDARSGHGAPRRALHGRQRRYAGHRLGRCRPPRTEPALAAGRISPVARHHAKRSLAAGPAAARARRAAALRRGNQRHGDRHPARFRASGPFQRPVPGGFRRAAERNPAPRPRSVGQGGNHPDTKFQFRRVTPSCAARPARAALSPRPSSSRRRNSTGNCSATPHAPRRSARHCRRTA